MPNRWFNKNSRKAMNPRQKKKLSQASKRLNRLEPSKANTAPEPENITLGLNRIEFIEPDTLL